MGRGFAHDTRRPFTGRARTKIAIDGSRWNERRAEHVVAVRTVLGAELDGLCLQFLR